MNQLDKPTAGDIVAIMHTSMGDISIPVSYTHLKARFTISAVANHVKGPRRHCLGGWISENKNDFPRGRNYAAGNDLRAFLLRLNGELIRLAPNNQFFRRFAAG